MAKEFEARELRTLDGIAEAEELGRAGVPSVGVEVEGAQSGYVGRDWIPRRARLQRGGGFQHPVCGLRRPGDGEGSVDAT